MKSEFNAATKFLNLLSEEDLPSSHCADPDEQFSFEWYENPNWILSVSVDPAGYLHYAARFDDYINHGKAGFINFSD